MKLTTMFCLLVLFSCYLFSQENQQSNIREEIKIKKAVIEKYVEGLKTRNFELIRNVCISETKLMNATDKGKYNLTTLDSWSKRFDPNNPPFKKLEYSILKVDRVGTAAQVKLLLIVNSKTRIIDFLHMLKLDNQWKIVSIIDY